MASIDATPVGDRFAPERTSRLVLRVAVYAGLILAVAGAAIAIVVGRQITAHAERTVGAKGEEIAATTLRRNLTPRDFAGPVSGARRAQLDALLRTRVLGQDVVGARLVNRRGTITYAALHRLIGTRIPYGSALQHVFAGRAVRRTTHTITWQGQTDAKVLQVLIPFRAESARAPVGALELDQDYRAVETTTSSPRNRLVLVLAIGLLALYLALFPILRRATAELEHRNRRLREQAVEREAVLAAERSARSEAESIQRLLAEQNDRLRELDRMKDEFVSLVSHQLRTPLTSIRGYIELMLEDEAGLTADQLRFLGVVDRNAQRLLDLVGDLLFLAQVDAGRLEIERARVDLARLVNECVEATRPIAGSRGVTLEATVESVPAVVGDSSRLAQVLDNVIANAIKFTSAGGRVSVRLSSTDDEVTLTVEDTGLGISPDDLDKIFGRFYRSSRAAANAIPGSGLGLPIAKAIVDRHDGRISVESREDDGTTVRLDLPVAAPTVEIAQVAAPSRVR